LSIDFDSDVNDRLRGVSRMESLEIILGEKSAQFSPAEKERLADRKNSYYRTMLQNMSPEDLPQDVRDTLLTLKSRGCKMAIGSSSKNTRFILQRIGLDGFFDAVADGTQISRSKPDPEVFLLAASLLGAQPKDCLVVEDAESGIRAAKAGGFKTIGLGKNDYLIKADYRIEIFPQMLPYVV